MKRLGIGSFLFLMFVAPLIAQGVGDDTTAGYNSERTSLFSNAEAVKPPYGLSQTIDVPEITSAGSFRVFDNQALVGGMSGGTKAYSLVDLETETALWTVLSAGSGAGDFDYIPALSQGIVLLGSVNTTAAGGVRAMRLSDGAPLWQDSTTGAVTGRSPILSSGLALYHGEQSVVAADAFTGTTYWQMDASTAEAPIALRGDQAYFLDKLGALKSVSLMTRQAAGTVLWSRPGVGSDGSSLIAADKMVFVADPETGFLTAVNSLDGSVAWQATAGVFGKPGVALAYNRLYGFYRKGGVPQIGAFDPETGTRLWEVQDPSNEKGLANHGMVVNNQVYFYNTGSQRIRVLDALTGNTLWSIYQPGVVGLTFSDGNLFALLENQIQVYTPLHKIFMPQMADGQGYSTLIVLTNLADREVEGVVEIFDGDGIPLPIQVEGLLDPVSSFQFKLRNNLSARFQTTGASDPLQVGWISVTADGPLSGTSIFQFGNGETILYEAGVEDSQPTSRAALLASRVSLSPLHPVSTGVAIANPGTEEANITITYLRRFPTVLEISTSLTLAPGSHQARFAEQFVGDLAGPGSEGTLLIESDIPIVITAIRTQDGFQMSSVPVGTP